MTHRYMKNERTLPLWAALGAPLVGVPLMVGLLAIATPRTDVPSEEPVSEVVAEPVDTHAVEPVSNDSAGQLDPSLAAS